MPTQLEARTSNSLPAPFLLKNARSFCHLRWAVVALLAFFGALSHLAPQLLEYLGLLKPVQWPFWTAAALAVANAGFVLHVRSLSSCRAPISVKPNLWCQIVVDLFVLTWVVHFVGSLETPVPFAYLFHIALACVFFSRRESLVAAVLAVALYSMCVGAEVSGLLQAGGIHAAPDLREHITGSLRLVLLNVSSTVVILLVVWYLTSHLSELVRERDFELTETNRRLQAAQEEKSKHIVRTTHELKAPFAAIHANAELLLKGYCGPLPEPATNVVLRIEGRCRRLAATIQEMLHLAELRSAEEGSLVWSEVDLAQLLEACIAQSQAVAEERGVAVEARLEPVRALAVPAQLHLLFANLLANALLYSRQGASVSVACRPDDSGCPIVTIEDRGIGIPREKLPRIFEEYYRTDEAVRHNKGSTGLGLAIVRHVAETHRIPITVESEPGQGTTFTLRFPALPAISQP